MSKIKKNIRVCFLNVWYTFDTLLYTVIQLECVNSLWMLLVFALKIVQGVTEIVIHIWGALHNINLE